MLPNLKSAFQKYPFPFSNCAGTVLFYFFIFLAGMLLFFLVALRGECSSQTFGWSWSSHASHGLQMLLCFTVQSSELKRICNKIIFPMMCIIIALIHSMSVLCIQHFHYHENMLRRSVTQWMPEIVKNESNTVHDIFLRRILCSV